MKKFLLMILIGFACITVFPHHKAAEVNALDLALEKSHNILTLAIECQNLIINGSR